MLPEVLLPPAIGQSILMVLKHALPERFSDGTPSSEASASPVFSGGVVRAGSRALPAVLAVLIATVASARAAETFGPMGRTVASEAAAVRMLSEAIVRAVRTLSEDEPDEPADVPERWAQFAGPDPALAGSVSQGERPAQAGPPLGWQSMVRPPPAE
jgi:hypothetical protein